MKKDYAGRDLEKEKKELLEFMRLHVPLEILDAIKVSYSATEEEKLPRVTITSQGVGDADKE